MESTSSGLVGQTRTDASGLIGSHYLGAAGEHLVAAYYLAEGQQVYFPLSQAGWVDLAVQTPHGFQRVQVKTATEKTGSVRVRDLGSTNALEPEDRYDVLAVVCGHRLWIIPAGTLQGRSSLTLHPTDHTCPWSGYRKR